MPRQYEAVYVFDSTLEDAAINDKLDRFHGLLGNAGRPAARITGAAASSPTRSAAARPATTSSRASTPSPPRFPSTSARIKLDDGVIRYLITLYEHEVGAPPMTEEELAAARPPPRRRRRRGRGIDHATPTKDLPVLRDARPLHRLQG